MIKMLTAVQELSLPELNEEDADFFDIDEEAEEPENDVRNYIP